MAHCATILAAAKFGPILRPKLGFIAMNLRRGKQNEAVFDLGLAACHSFQCYAFISMLYPFDFESILISQSFHSAQTMLDCIIQTCQFDFAGWLSWGTKHFYIHSFMDFMHTTRHNIDYTIF